MLRIRAELVTAEQNSVDEPEDEAQDENATQIKPNGPLPVVFSSSAATRRSTSSWIRKVSSTCAQLRKRLVEADPANKTQIKLGGVPNPLTSDASSRAAPKWSQLITKAIGKITSALGRKKATKPDINEDSLYLIQACLCPLPGSCRLMDDSVCKPQRRKHDGRSSCLFESTMAWGWTWFRPSHRSRSITCSIDAHGTDGDDRRLCYLGVRGLSS